MLLCNGYKVSMPVLPQLGSTGSVSRLADFIYSPTAMIKKDHGSNRFQRISCKKTDLRKSLVGLATWK